MNKGTKILIGLGAVTALSTTAFVHTGIADDKVSRAVFSYNNPVAEKTHFSDKTNRHQQAGFHRRGGPKFRESWGAGLLEQFDTDKDGKLTQAELDKSRADRLRKFDSNKDGKLTLQEYAALWVDAMRSRTVRNFQRHDTDGDAVVTTEEFGARFTNMIKRLDRNEDGALSLDDRPRPYEGRRGGHDREVQ